MYIWLCQHHAPSFTVYPSCIVKHKLCSIQGLEHMAVAHYGRQQSLTVDRIVDSLALEAATSYGGTRKPAAAHALKKQLHAASRRLPSLAAATAASLASLPDLPAAAAASEAAEQHTAVSSPPLPDLPAAAAASEAEKFAVDDIPSATAFDRSASIIGAVAEQGLASQEMVLDVTGAGATAQPQVWCRLLCVIQHDHNPFWAKIAY